MELKEGDKIALADGGAALVGKEIGRGGQGIVYRATVGGKPRALKWYTCKFADKKKFKANLKKNIVAGAPDGRFLWPLYMVEEKGGFGYVMELRPKELSSFPDILNNKVKFPSTGRVIDAALDIVGAFDKLHCNGYSYQDLNDGNFFIDVKAGKALICDNDNVTGGAQKNPGNVSGKPGYMAPEIVRGDAHPTANTDYHSLAVILFKLFFRHDPLMGDAYVKSVCITEKRELELYGTQPVFIFDPNDKSNRPVKGVHHNPLKLWPLYPEFFQNAFVQAFGDGMKNPDSRLPDREWAKILVRLRDDLMVCPCGGRDELFLSKTDKNNPVKFGGCGHAFSRPYCLAIGQRYAVPLLPGKKLYACHADAGVDDYSTVVGEVVANKKNPSLWGVKNLSKDSWYFTPSTGGGKAVGSGEVVPIGNGVSIKFKGGEGKIDKKA